MSAKGRVRSLAGESVRLNIDQVDPGGALRCTVGVMIPLIVGLSAGGVADGVFAAIGALCAGFASFQGAYRGRAAITVIVGAGMATALVSGALAARADWSAIAVVGLFGLISGMMASLSQAALVIGLQWCVAVIIVNAVPMSTGDAFVYGAMVFAGALFQTLLVVAAWPLRMYRPERRALAAAYRELASYAERAATDPAPSVAPTVLDDARQVLRDPQPFGQPAQMLAFQALLDEGERIRLQLVALTNRRRSLEQDSPRTEALDRYLQTAAAVLRTVAIAVLADTDPGGSEELATRLAADLDALSATEPVSGEVPGWQQEDVLRIAGALAGQLRSVLRIADRRTGSPSESEFKSHARPRYHRRRLGDVALTVRANLSWQSEVFRHAVRLAVTLAVSMAIFKLSGLPHGYWIALTALLVLRPDFATTAVRGLSRVAGTLVGAGLATLVVAAIKPDNTGLTVMFGVASCLAFLIVRVNYAVFSACVTAYVVFLLGFEQIPAVTTAGDRALSTVIGGGLAIAVYFLWPTWQSRSIGPRLAELFDAQARYAEGVLCCFADPSSELRSRLGAFRAATRLARSNAESSLSAMASEPERSRREAPVSLETGRALIAAGRRGSVALLTLHADLPQPVAPPLPPLAPFSEQLVGEMRHNALSARELVPPSLAESSAQTVFALARRGSAASDQSHRHGEVDLRKAHSQLVEALKPLGERDGFTVELLTEETDELVDVTHTIDELLQRG